MSKAESTVEKWLLDERISFTREEPCLSYSLDFYLPEWHLCIEVDGPYIHHIASKNMRRDAKVRGRGVVTLRLTSTDVASKPDDCKARIREFIEHWAGSTKERKELRNAREEG